MGNQSSPVGKSTITDKQPLYNLHYKARKAGCKLHSKSKTFSVPVGTSLADLPKPAQKLVYKYHYFVQTVIE